MEIGAEISNKIRGAIKGKLQELGAYVDEELPDYIMVMVANKKTREQMTDDLSLFLGSSTCKFTVWLHGVLEKLRSATSDPNSQKSTDAIIFGSSMSSCKSLSGGSDDGMPDEPGLAISRTRPERHDPRVSTSTLGQSAIYGRQHSEDGPAARLTSTVKPLRDLAPSEAIIDIQPNADDLIDEDLNFLPENPSFQPENPNFQPENPNFQPQKSSFLPENSSFMPENHNFQPENSNLVPENPLSPRKKASVPLPYRSSRPTAALYRPPGSSLHHNRGADMVARTQRLPQASVQPDKLPEAQSCRPLETITQYSSEGFGQAAETHRPTLKSSFERPVREEENLRKRKLPSISSVVKVKKFSSDGHEEDDDEEDDDHGPRSLSLPSSVSVPAKPERRPTLPLCKQANKNLILKAISEAQESVTKTTNYSTVPQKQTVPVAPRTRMTQDGPMIEMIRAQTAPSRPSYLQQAEPLRESGLERLQGAHQRQDLFSRLRLDAMEEPIPMNPDAYEVGAPPFDSRSFILKRPQLSEEIAPQKQPYEKVLADGLQAQAQEQAQAPAPPGRLIQSRAAPQSEKPVSPKFIVTLDGVPSPPGYASEQEEEEMEFIEQGEQDAKESSTAPDKKAKKARVQQKAPRRPGSSDGEEDSHSVPAKQKLAERCKYWPACKNGDACAYHHPTAPCKAYPKCRFAEKCLFIHPNCKYDAKCTKSDCPYTHASRRNPVPPPMLGEATVALSLGTYCRYDASCNKLDCPYTHASQLNPVLPPKLAQVAAQASSVLQCRFFPACKKMECPFYHPKLCRYNTQCKRPDCTFYHPSATVPPRHALKWTRPQTSE